MEVHLVHANTEGNLAVVTVVFEEGNENETLKKIWSTMSEETGNKKGLSSIDGLFTG